MVGYLEYEQALRALEELVKTSTEEELRIADTIVREWDRHVVRMDDRHIAQASDSAQRQQPSDVKAVDRRGLAWVMALARIERAAMIVVTMLDNSTFSSLQCSSFEEQALQTLLEHDAATSWWSLRQDPVYRQLEENDLTKLNPHVVQTYYQRLTMVEAFQRGVLRFKPRQHTSETRALLRKRIAQTHAARQLLVSYR